MNIAPNTRKRFSQSLPAALIEDVVDGTVLLATKVDHLTDPITEPVTGFFSNKIENLRVRKALRQARKESINQIVEAKLKNEK